MRKSLLTMICAAATVILTACLSPAGGVSPRPVVMTPTPAPVTDTFFSAQALLDVNVNGQIDTGDTPIAGATFIVTLPGGAEFGAQTDQNGKAFITVPSRVEYPVTARMEAPKDSGLTLLEPSTISLNEPTGETVQFLFGQ
ncbi:MAG: hypothetical protein OHK0041_26370 [Anaerolineales bacterium]